MMNPLLDSRLRIVWDHAGANPIHRYIPKATNPPALNWRVFDRKENKFLSDEELVAVSERDLEAMFPSKN